MNDKTPKTQKRCTYVYSEKLSERLLKNNDKIMLYKRIFVWIQSTVSDVSVWVNPLCKRGVYFTLSGLVIVTVSIMVVCAIFQFVDGDPWTEK